jgi:tetratricopeptide (TPR) repeat protein/predicted Ser/Thr protein kinase
MVLAMHHTMELAGPEAGAEDLTQAPAGDEPDPSEVHSATMSLGGDSADVTEAVARLDHQRPRPTPLRASVPGYEILGELGRGGMGVVYKARQKGLNRLVALKMILSGGHASSGDLARFRLEAEAVAKLKHPNIVQIYEIGEHFGQPYFSLEFVDGGSLDKKLAGTPQPAAQAAGWVETMARAMHEAHKEGIIHRDLKPANVLLTGDGVPKIMDFGLAKRIDEGDSGQTRTGAIMGTPSYMAPEQAEGRIKELGPATDIYSLGAILYDLITGRPPFRGETVMDTLQLVVSAEPVSPVRLHPKVPRDLETICLKCLQKEPAKRYPTSWALAEDLRRFLDGRPIEARPVGALERAWKWAKRRPAAAALAAVSAAVVVALVVGGLWFGQHEYRQRLEADRLMNVAQANEAEALKQEKNARDEQARAERERRRADQNFVEARQAVDEMLTRVGDRDLANEPRLERVRRDLLIKALTLYQGFVKEQDADPEVRRETARAYRRVGDIQYLLGDFPAAAAAYQSSQGLFEQLAAQFKAKPEYRLELAQVHARRSVMLQGRGDNPGAEKAATQALKIRTELVAAHPKNRFFRHDLASSFNNLGLLRLPFPGRRPQAVQDFEKAIALFDKLAKEFPDEPKYVLELAKACSNLGGVLTHMSRFADAEKAFLPAVADLNELVKKYPNESDFTRELGQAYSNLGVMHQLNRKPAKAREVYEQAVTLFTDLKNRFPNTPDYRQQLAFSYNNLGNLHHEQKQYPDAVANMEKARDIYVGLAREFRFVPTYRQELARAYYNLGRFHAAQGKVRPAETAFLEAVTVQDRLVVEFSWHTDYRKELAATYEALGGLYVLDDQPDKVEQNYRRALAVWGELEGLNPGELEYRKSQISLLAKLVQFYTDYEQPEKAEQCWADVIKVQDRTVRQLPNDPANRNSLAVFQNHLAGLLIKRDEAKEALPHLREAVRNERAAMKLAPGQAAYQQSLGNYSLTLVEALVHLKDHAGAAQAAAELSKDAPAAWKGYHLAAGLLARCIPLAARDASLPAPKQQELAQQYGDQAMGLLSQAQKQGFKSADYLKTADFKPLESRPDFKKLLAGLQGQKDADGN